MLSGDISQTGLFFFFWQLVDTLGGLFLLSGGFVDEMFLLGFLAHMSITATGAETFRHWWQRF